MSVLEVKAEDWEKKILKSDTLAIVDFWHDLCIWCKQLEPIYREVAEEYGSKVRFAKLNVLESKDNQQIAVQYGVMGVPALIFFCNGRPVETAIGFQSKEALKKRVDDVINRHLECVEKSTELKTK